MPPEIDPDKLDFSECHMLDHWPGGPYCRSLPGGTRNHLALAWDFKWRPRLLAKTLCRLNLHQWATGWTKWIGECRVCQNCWAYRET